MKHVRHYLTGSLMLLSVLIFSFATAQQATFRFVNACPDQLASSIDIEVDYGGGTTDTLFGLAYVHSSAPFDITANQDFDLNVYEAGTANQLGTWSSPTGGYAAQDYVVALTGVFSPGKTGAGLDVHVSDFESSAPAGQSQFEILHAVENLPIDVRFDMVEDGTGTVTNVGDNVSFTEYSPDTGALDLPAGDYTLRVSGYIPALTPVDSFDAVLSSGQSATIFVIGDDADNDYETGLYVMDNAGGPMFQVPSLTNPIGEIDEIFVLGFNNSLGAYRSLISAFGIPNLDVSLQDEPQPLVLRQTETNYDASLRLEDPTSGQFIDSLLSRPLFKPYPAVDTGYITFVYGDLQVGGGGLDTAYLEQVSRDPAINPNGPLTTTEFYAFHAMLNAPSAVDFYIYPEGSPKPASPTFDNVAYGAFSADSAVFSAGTYSVILASAGQNDTIREYRFELEADDFGVLFTQGDLNAKSGMYFTSYRDNLEELQDLNKDMLLHVVHDIDDPLYSTVDLEIREPGAATPLATYDGLDYRHAAPIINIGSADELSNLQLTVVLKEPSSGVALSTLSLNDPLEAGSNYIFYLTKRENDTDPSLITAIHKMDTASSSIPGRYFANGIENSGCQTFEITGGAQGIDESLEFLCDYSLRTDILLPEGVFDAALFSTGSELPTADYELDVDFGSQFGWILSGSDLNDSTQGLYRVPITGGPFELIVPLGDFSVKSQVRLVNASVNNQAPTINAVVDTLNGGQIASVFGIDNLHTSDTITVPAGNQVAFSFNDGVPGSSLASLTPGVGEGLRGGALYNVMFVGDANTTGYQIGFYETPTSFDENTGNYSIYNAIPGDNPTLDFRYGEAGQTLTALNSFLNFGNSSFFFETGIGDVELEQYTQNTNIDIAKYTLNVPTGGAGSLVLHADTFPDPMLYRFPDGAGALIPLGRDTLYPPTARMYLVHDVAEAGNVDIQVVHPDGKVFASWDDVPFRTPLNAFELPSDSVFVIEVYEPGTSNLLASYNSMTEDFVGDGMAELGREYGILLNFVDNSNLDIEPWYTLQSPGGNDVALLGYNGMVGSPDLYVSRSDVDGVPGFPGQYDLPPFSFNSYDQFEPGPYDFTLTSQSDPEPLRIYEGDIPVDFQGLLLLSGTYPDDYGLFLVPQDGSDYIPLTLKFSAGLSDDKLLQSDFRIFPNPAHEQVTLDCPSMGHVVVTDLMGRELQRIPVRAGVQQINVADLPGGLFHVTYTNGETQLSKKLIINR
ncbi:MAG: T9SS type A sorting domain-containing protein [Bacteroidota bacterium]